MSFIISSMILSIANTIPNFYSLKLLKGFFLRLSGIKLNFKGIYFVSPIKFDRPKNIIIGKGVFINQNVYFEGEGKISIGQPGQSGPNVVISTTSHDIKNDMMNKKGDIKILDNVWIGSNVVLTKDIVVGPNVIIGAGSIMTKSCKNCVVAGNPAKIISEI